MVVGPILCRSFVGRHEELAYLASRRASAASSHGGLVLIAGEPGSGKSRLVREFTGPLGSTRWRIGFGFAFEHARRPYGPVLTALASVDASFEEAFAPLGSRDERFDALAERFALQAKRGGVIAVLEDMHWADAATIELLTFLAPRLERMRALVLATYRPSAAATGEAFARLERAAGGGRIRLDPLAEPDVRALIDDAAADHRISAATRRLVARRSEGNPFFAEELLRAAVEREAERPGASAPASLPSTIRATVLERWHTLPQADRAVVAQAAVIGRYFDTRLLERICDRPESDVIAALQRARDVQLVEELEPHAFRFRHALTRDAVYAHFTGVQARALHARIAAALSDSDGATRDVQGSAYHWWAAGDAARAAPYHEAAGDAAARLHAHEDALASYERALEAPESEPLARARVQEKIGEICIAISAMDRAGAAFAAAANDFARCGALEAEARCRVRAAQTSYAIGEPEPIAALDAMLERVPAGASLARARIHLGIAWLSATFWHPSRAASHLAAVDARALDADPEAALRFRNVAAWIAMTTADLAAFRREHAAWIEAARALDRPGLLAAAHYNGAACYALFGFHDEASAQLELAVARARAERNRHGVEGAAAIGALCRLYAGDLAGAVASLETVPPSTGNRVTIGDAAAAGMLAGLHLGDDALVTRWFDAARKLGGIPDGACGGALAQAFAARGDVARAREVLRDAVVDCERVRGNVYTLLAVARFGAPDETARARRLLAAAADPEDSLEWSALHLFDALVLSRDGRLAEAERAGASAAGGFARAGFPLFEAAACEAAGVPGEALAIYRRCGATSDVRRLGGAAAAAGTSRPRGPGRALELSARELEVARFIAGGASNAAIARALQISHKTVEKHLGSIYGKLGLRSRTQLAALLGSSAVAESERLETF